MYALLNAPALIIVISGKLGQRRAQSMATLNLTENSLENSFSDFAVISCFFSQSQRLFQLRARNFARKCKVIFLVFLRDPNHAQ
jgi:hypothetical protein